MRNLFIFVRNDECHSEKDYIRIRDTLWSDELKKYARMHDLRLHLLLIMSGVCDNGVVGKMPAGFLDHYVTSPTGLHNDWTGCTAIDLYCADMAWEYLYDCIISQSIINLSFKSDDLVFIAQDNVYYDPCALVRMLEVIEKFSPSGRFCFNPRFHHATLEINDLAPYVNELQSGWSHKFSAPTEGARVIFRNDPKLSYIETQYVSAAGLLITVETAFMIADKAIINVSDSTFDYALERFLAEKNYNFVIVEQARAAIKRCPYCVFLDSPVEISRIQPEMIDSFDKIILGLEAPDVDRIVKSIDEYLTITEVADRCNVARRQWASSKSTSGSVRRLLAACLLHLIRDGVIHPERERYNKLRIDGIIKGLEKYHNRYNEVRLEDLFASHV